MHLCQTLQHWQNTLSGPPLLYPSRPCARLLGTVDGLNYRFCSHFIFILVIIHINFNSENLEGIQRNFLTCV